MKKIVFGILTTLFIFTSSGCTRRINLRNEEPSIDNVNKVGSYVKKMDISFNDTTYKQLLEDALEDFKGTDDYDSLYDVISKVVLKTNELVKKYYAAEALHNSDYDNKEYKEKYDILSDSYYEYESFRANLIVELSNDYDLLREILGEDYTDEELEFEIELSKKKASDTYKNLKKEIDEISDEYNKLNVSLRDDSNKALILDNLYRFVNKNKELSSYLGFDSYIEYIDTEYSRIYTYDEEKEFISNVKDYILPLMDNNRSVLDLKKKVKSLTYPEYNYLIELTESSAYDRDYNTINLAKDYAKKLGGSYYSTFRDYLNEGHFIFSDSSNSLDSGYTTPYLSYFGPNYQDIETVIHEFGHYYSINNGNVLYKSLDLKEFYSQGNEYLFLKYLENTSYENTKNVYDVYSCYKLVNSCQTLIIGSALREFERKIYTFDLSESADLENIWTNLNYTDYNRLLQDYWKFEVRYDNYYLSYSTSTMGALSLYTYANTNFEKAGLAYMNASCNDNEDDDLIEVLTKAKLVNPFSEDAFKAVVEFIKEKR